MIPMFFCKILWAFLFPCLVSLFSVSESAAQEKTPVTYGNVYPDDFTINASIVDSNTSAVIMADIGNTRFEGNSKGWFDYILKRQTRIKIIDKKRHDS